MDLNKLHSLSVWLNYSSFTLNTEQQIILNSSLVVLQNENHFKKIFFWGVIQGLESDYYIAFGYRKDAITNRLYFYSDDWQNWKLLPVPQPDHLSLTELCKKPFQGDPGLVLEIVDDAPVEEMSYEEEITESKEQTNEIQPDEIQPEAVEKERSSSQIEPAFSLDAAGQPITSGELKEEDRLAAIVHIISEETAIVPRGGLFKQTDGITVHSKAFEGLQLDDADELCSFQHYRQPREEWNTNLLMRVDYNYALDFLDTIDKDIPSDCWTAQLVEGDRTILLRCLTWPGFFFFHQLQTPDYGYVYIGSGQRNLDIPFMTQVTVEANSTLQSKSSKDFLSSRLSHNISKQELQETKNTIDDEAVEPPAIEAVDSPEIDTKEGEIIFSA